MGACLWDWKGFKLGVLRFRVGAGPGGHWGGRVGGCNSCNFFAWYEIDK